MRLEISGPDGKRIFNVRSGASLISLGRGAGCDISLPKDEALSDLHLRLNQFMGSWSVTDQFSDNGTKVNGESVLNAPLKNGDVISAGATTLRVLDVAGGGNAAAPASRAGAAASISFESVSSDPLQWKEPQPTAFGTSVQGDVAATPHSSPPPAADSPAWAPTRRDTARMTREAVSRAQAAVRAAPPQPSPAPQQHYSGRTPAVYSGTPQHHQHAHVAHHSPPPWEARAAVQAAPETKRKSGNVAGCIFGLIVVGVIFAGIFGDLIKELAENKPENSVSHSNNTPPRTNTPPRNLPPANLKDSSKADSGKPAAPAWDSVRQREANTRIRAIREDKSRTSAQRIDDIAAYLAAQPPDPPHYVTNSRDIAVRALKNEINIELSLRYSQDQRDIFDLVQKNHFAKALLRLDGLKAHAENTEHHTAEAKQLGITQYLKDKREDIERRSEEFGGGCLNRMDWLLAAGCNALALIEIETLLEGAVLSDNVRKALEAERDALKAEARVKPGSASPPPPRPRALSPVPPRNSLLPAGVTTQSNLIRRLRDKFVQSVNGPALKDAPCVLHGREAELESLKSGQYRFVARRKLEAAGEILPISYPVMLRHDDIPPAVLAGLYARIPEMTGENLLGLMLYCYDFGLNEDAARAALRCLREYPDQRTELEAIMAVKLGIDPPPGGFVERDDMLVPG